MQKQPTLNKVNISFMGEAASSNSPQADAFKISGIPKRNGPVSSLEYQYASNSNGTVNSGISKGGGFFPQLRNKNANGTVSQQRESNLAQNGSNSVFPLGQLANPGNQKQTRLIALPLLNEEDSVQQHSSSTQQLLPSNSSYNFQLQG